MKQETKNPKVGVGVIIKKDNKVLLGKRKNSHGEGDWALPGGHLEFGESLVDCAEREVLEETSMLIENVKPSTFTNDIFTKEDKHYITLYVVCDWKSGEVKRLEPEKCEMWKWFEWENLPTPLFIPMENLLKQNYTPFE